MLKSNKSQNEEKREVVTGESECRLFRDAVWRYLVKNNLTQADLAKKLEVSENTVKNWTRKDYREPRVEVIYNMADKLDLSFDELLRGVPTNNLDAHQRTGLSMKAIDTLAHFHQAHTESPNIYVHLHPLLNMFLEDKEFLEEIDTKVWRLVRLKAEQYAYDCDEEEVDLADAIEYKISRMLVEKIRKYVDAVIPAESDSIRKKDLEEMLQEIRRRETT